MWWKSKATPVVAVVVFCLVAGLALGTLIAEVIGSAREREQIAKRAEVTQQVLQSMGTLEIGDTLADHQFEDLAGEPVLLSKLLKGETWIGIIEPTCESCVEDLRNLRDQLNDPQDAPSFIFLSASNPRFLQDMKVELGLQTPFLYDHRRAWSNQYNFFTYPFHLRVDRNLRVLEVVAGTLSQEQIKSILSE